MEIHPKHISDEAHWSILLVCGFCGPAPHNLRPQNGLAHVSYTDITSSTQILSTNEVHKYVTSSIMSAKAGKLVSVKS